MNWLSRLFGESPSQPQENTSPFPPGATAEPAIQEQINPALFTNDPEDSRANSGSEEDLYWHSLSDLSASQKDMPVATYLELHALVYEAYQSNPLAFAIIELGTSFVLGRGLTISAASPRVQRVIDAFWRDPDNRMDERIYSIVNELSLYGELFIRFFVNRYSGQVKIRLIDPSLIDQIETDPEDVETPLRFHRRPLAQLAEDMSMKMQPALQEDDGHWFEAGDEVVQFAINKVSNAKRGTSDLTTLLPWLRRYKDWLTDRVRINKYKGAFLWDITLKGADKKTIDRKRMEYGYPPEPGSVLIHNESEEWKAVQPAINAQDAYQDGRAIKLMIAAGASLPEHFLSDGTSSTRATAAEMGLPTLLKFQRRQKIIGTILHTILDRVIAEAQAAGKLGSNANTQYEITFPDINTDDSQTVGAGLYQLSQALSTAKAQGWISDETAMRLMYKFAGEDVDIHEERARIETQIQAAKIQQPEGEAGTA